MYTVSAVKTFKGREGIGYSCNLCRDGKKVAEVIEEAHGGELIVRFADAGRVIGRYRTYTGEVVTKPMSPEEALFEEHVLVQPKVGDDYPNGHMVIEELVNAVEIEKRVKRELGKKVLYTKADGKVYATKAAPNAIVLDGWIMRISDRPDTVAVLNNLPLAQAVKLMGL